MLELSDWLSFVGWTKIKLVLVVIATFNIIAFYLTFQRQRFVKFCLQSSFILSFPQDSLLNRQNWAEFLEKSMTQRS